jgi:hypothetical protein
MAVPRERSTFWLVSTHVLTAGLSMPLLAGIVAFIARAAGWAPREPLMELVFVLVVVSFGYIGGTFYSLHYLRRVAIVREPRACLIPSIAMFGAFCALPLGVSFGNVSVVEFGLLTAYFVGVTSCFAFITQHGIRRMVAAQEARGFPIEPLRPMQ